MMATSLIISGILSLLVSIVVARSVSVAQFGIYSITVSLQNVVGIFSAFSIGTAVAKYVSEYAVRDPKQAVMFVKTGLRLVLLFSSVTAVVYFVLADLIGNGLYDEPGVAELIPFSALVVFSLAVLALASGVAQGNHRMKLLSSMQVATPAISLCVIAAFIPYVGVRIAFVSLFIAQMTVSLSALYRLSRTSTWKWGKMEPQSETDHPKILLSFAVPAVIATVMVVPLYWFGNTVLALYSGFLAVGQFAIALVFFQALSIMPYALALPLVPRVSEMSVHSKDEIESLISRAVRAVSVLFFPVFFALALFCRPVIGILYGSDYYDSTEAVYLVVAACYLSATVSTVGAAITGLGRMWVGLGLNMAWAGIFAVVALIAVPMYGPEGLGLAYAVSYGIHLVNTIVTSEKVLHLRIQKIVAPIAPAVVLFAVGFSLVMDTDALSFVWRLVLLAAGTGLMLWLGRKEFKMVYDRVLTRGHGSA